MAWFGNLSQLPNSSSFVVAEGGGETQGCAQQSKAVSELLQEQHPDGLVCSFEVQISHVRHDGMVSVGLSPHREVLPLTLDGESEAERGRRCFVYSSAGEIMASLCTASSTGCMGIESEPYGLFDTIGCIVDLRHQDHGAEPGQCMVAFTKNGKVVGLVPATQEAILPLRPSATLSGPGTMVSLAVHSPLPHLFGALRSEANSLGRIQEVDSAVEAGQEASSFTIHSDAESESIEEWVWEEGAQGGEREEERRVPCNGSHWGGLDSTWGSITLDSTMWMEAEASMMPQDAGGIPGGGGGGGHGGGGGGGMRDLAGQLARARREIKLLKSRAVGVRDAANHAFRQAEASLKEQLEVAQNAAWQAQEARSVAEADLKEEQRRRKAAQAELSGAVEILRRAEEQILHMQGDAEGKGEADALERAMTAEGRQRDAEERAVRAESMLVGAEERARGAERRMGELAKEVEVGRERAEEKHDEAMRMLGAMLAERNEALEKVRELEGDARQARSRADSLEVANKEAEECARRSEEQAVCTEAHLEEERACRQHLSELLEEERSAGRRLRESLGELTVAVKRNSEEGSRGGDQASLKASLEEAMLRFAKALSDRNTPPPPQQGDAASEPPEIGAAYEIRGDSRADIKGVSPGIRRDSKTDIKGEAHGVGAGSSCSSSSVAGGRKGRVVVFQDEVNNGGKDSGEEGRRNVESRVSPPKVHWRVREEPGGANKVATSHRNSSMRHPIATPPSQGASPLSLLRGSLTIVRSSATPPPGDAPPWQSGPDHGRPPAAPTAMLSHVPLPGGRTAAALRGNAKPRAAEPDAGPSSQGYYIEAAGNSTTVSTISPRVLFAGRSVGVGVGLGEIFPGKSVSLSDDGSVRDDYSYVSDATEA